MRTEDVLRVGNFIKDRSGKTMRIDFFERDKVCHKMFVGNNEVHPLTEDFDKLQFIELTKEIIEDAEFHWPNESLCVSYGMCGGDVHFVVGRYYKKIKFVHELQNLYLDFVGKKLTFKSK